MLFYRNRNVKEWKKGILLHSLRKLRTILFELSLGRILDKDKDM